MLEHSEAERKSKVVLCHICKKVKYKIECFEADTWTVMSYDFAQIQSTRLKIDCKNMKSSDVSENLSEFEQMLGILNYEIARHKPNEKRRRKRACWWSRAKRGGMRRAWGSVEVNCAGGGIYTCTEKYSIFTTVMRSDGNVCTKLQIGSQIHEQKPQAWSGLGAKRMPPEGLLENEAAAGRWQGCTLCCITMSHIGGRDACGWKHSKENISWRASVDNVRALSWFKCEKGATSANFETPYIIKSLGIYQILLQDSLETDFNFQSSFCLLWVHPVFVYTFGKCISHMTSKCQL